MNVDFYRFAYWSILILAAATGVIMYQHATHTNLILSLLPGGDNQSPVPDPASFVSSNPNTYGAFSRASGQWTPLGPPGQSVFPYLPAQSHQ